MSRHDWSWAWLPDLGSGTERFAGEVTPAGAVLSGTVAAVLKGTAIDARYRVEVDAGWTTRKVAVAIANLGRSIDLTANGIGRWSDAEGVWIPALDGCIDVDISLTPSTNILPIRRLGLQVGESAEVTVAYLLAPELALRPGRQRYTRLADRLWRFEAPEFNFAADITVDADCFVVDYPGLFRRD